MIDRAVSGGVFWCRESGERDDERAVERCVRWGTREVKRRVGSMAEM